MERLLSWNRTGSSGVCKVEVSKLVRKYWDRTEGSEKDFRFKVELGIKLIYIANGFDSG